MRAITIHEPYATAIVTGVKRYETRPRRTNIRGLVAIHAGLKRTSLDFSKANIYLKPEYLAYGAVVGFAEIADCVPVEEIRGNLSDVELAMGDYSPGRFAWVLKNPIMLLTIVPAKGKQGWWQWDASEIRGCELCPDLLYGKCRFEEPEPFGACPYRSAPFIDVTENCYNCAYRMDRDVCVNHESKKFCHYVLKGESCEFYERYR